MGFFIDFVKKSIFGKLGDFQKVLILGVLGYFAKSGPGKISGRQDIFLEILTIIDPRIVILFVLAVRVGVFTQIGFSSLWVSWVAQTVLKYRPTFDDYLP